MVRMSGLVIWSLPRQQLPLVSLRIICYKLSNRTPNFMMQISLCVRILHSCSLLNDNQCVMSGFQVSAQQLLR